MRKAVRVPLIHKSDLEGCIDDYDAKAKAARYGLKRKTDRVPVWSRSFWETNQTSDVPVMRVSNDNGATFGPMLVLAANGTIGEAEEEPEEGE